MQPIWAVGLMTGTVLDGNIDVALLKTDGETVMEFGAYALKPYPPSIRELLERAQAEARIWNFEGQEPAVFAEAEEALTRAQSAAVRELVMENGLSMADIGVVGFHGQTVLHRAPQGGRHGDTRQLGDGVLMSELIGTKVVYDFRTADIRAGGQGAPLAAIYHAALLGTAGGHGDMAILNLGGVGNITWWDGGDTLVAFDTGPANAPINDFVRAQGLGEMDRDGLIAARGRVDEARLGQLLKHSYFTKPYPKSLDRFGERFTHRVFTEGERVKSDRRATRAASYARRFAAKEACSKALGTGMRAGVFWRDMEVVNLPGGRPTMRLTGGAAEKLKTMTPAGFAAVVHVSLTDDPPLAQAFVVIEARPLAG